MACLFYLFIVLISRILLENLLAVTNLILGQRELHGIRILKLDLDCSQG